MILQIDIRDDQQVVLKSYSARFPGYVCANRVMKGNVMHHPCNRQLASRVHSIRHAECAFVRSSRLWKQIAMNEREVKFIDRARKRNVQVCNPRCGRHCGSKSSLEARANVCVCVCV